MSARFFSASMPFSVMLLFEPTPTYSNEPSRLATRLLVQWWSIGPPGSGVSIVPGAVILVSPGV
jgi:hypothetical protein